MIRSGVYTIFNNEVCKLWSNDQEYKIYYYGQVPPSKLFLKNINHPNIFYLPLHKEQISNAFFITTKALYKDFVFDINHIEGSSYRIVTSNSLAYEKLGLELYERGVYQKTIEKNQVEKVWEERTKSSYDFPMPFNIKSIQEVKL